MPRLFTILVCAFALFLSFPGSAQQSRSISVRGESAFEVPPDVACMIVFASATEKSEEAASKKTNCALNTVTEYAKSMGVNPDHVVTRSIQVRPKREPGKRTGKVKGYRATNYVDVRILDLKNVNKILAKINETKDASLQNIWYDHSRCDSLEEAAQLLAIDDARRLATKLAKKADGKLGKILKISNGSASKKVSNISIGTPHHANWRGREINVGSMVCKDPAYTNVKVEPGLVTFKGNIQVEFELR